MDLDKIYLILRPDFRPKQIFGTDLSASNNINKKILWK